MKHRLPLSRPAAGLGPPLAGLLLLCLAAAPVQGGVLGANGKAAAKNTGPGSKAPTRHAVKPKAVRNLDVIDHRGDKLPLDLVFKDSTGKPVKLSDVINPNIPVVFDFEYFTCPVLCPLVQGGIADAVKKMGWRPGKQFQIVTVSFDPKDTPKMAAKKKFNALHRAGYPNATDGWHFLTGKQPQIEQLTKAAGFEYHFLPDREQFAHLAFIMVLTGKGKISRYLYGVKYPVQTLRLSLVSASDGSVGSALDKILLCCFSYNEKERKYTATAKMVMSLAGGVTLAALVGVLGLAFLFESRRRKNPPPGGGPGGGDTDAPDAPGPGSARYPHAPPASGPS